MIETLSTAADIIMAAAAAKEQEAAAAAAVTTAEPSAPESGEDSASSPHTTKKNKKTVVDAANLVSSATTSAPAPSIGISGIREMTGPVSTPRALPANVSSLVSAPSAASIIAAAQRAAVLAGVGSENHYHPTTVGVGAAAVAAGTQQSSLLVGHHHNLQLSAGAMAAAHHHNHLTGAVKEVSAAAPSPHHHLSRTSEASSAAKAYNLPAPSLHGRRGPPKKRNAGAAALATYLDLNIPSVPSSSAGTAAALQPAGDATTSGDSTSSEDVTHSVVKATQQAAMTEDEKKAERRAANRRSAFQSRQRRKILIEDLQRTVAALSKDNADLRSLNQDLQQQLEVTLIENRQLQAKLGVATNNSSPATARVDEVPVVATSTTFDHDSTAAIKAAAAQQQAQAKAEAQARAIAEAQAAHAAKIAAEQEQQLIRARLQLMAAQNRVSELEYQHHHHPSSAASVVGPSWNAASAPSRVALSDTVASSGESFPVLSILDKSGGTGVGGAAKNGSPSAAAQAHLARLQELRNIRNMLAASKADNTGQVRATDDVPSAAESLSVYLLSAAPLTSASSPFVGSNLAAIQNSTSVTAATPDARENYTKEDIKKQGVVATFLSVTSPANGATLPPTPKHTPAATLPLASSVTCTSSPSSSLAEAPGLHLLIQSLKAKSSQESIDDRPTNF
eukprot:CAMPEP_0113462288 /NCGR_PEP_ID=MMETSP0014_2-20120614/12004_1 /TAXON_ID=2857 /ORGANISM="Nitzschia sp." /LENGTH=676 /DNA_ID=CAMNT_0000354125 /DNA_START=290 /DNA_END=2320 /DNA_ORIENTATION=- /assembly_acc=CAM_ASM_000159